MLLCFAYHTVNRGKWQNVYQVFLCSCESMLLCVNNCAYAWVLKLEKKLTFFSGENDAEWYYNHANMEYRIWHTESPFWDRPREVGGGQGRIKTTVCGYLGGCTLSERLQLFVQDNTGKHARGVDSIIQQITKTFSMSQHIHTPISDHMRKLILINYAVTVGIELIEPRQNVCVLEGLSHNHKRAPDFVAAMHNHK